MTTDPMAAREWIAMVSIPVASALAERWDEYTQCPLPVVTLHGAYSTGKTALLRRLLVDSGQAVPEWVSISGGPATFESREAIAEGVILRDSPGVMPGAEGNRDDLNNSEAKAALQLTDAMLLMFNPQLATSDRDWVRALLALDWPEGSIVYVIGRFDLAMDPTESPDGYTELAGRKCEELRSILGVPADTPIHVVAQDPFGLSGSDQVVDKSVWDESRDWDGVAELRAALQLLPPLADLRVSAGQRFWTAAVGDVLDELLRKREEGAHALSFAEAEERRQQQRLTRLSAIQDEANVNLTRLVEESTRTAVESEHSPDQAKALLRDDLDAWFAETMAELETLRADVVGESEQERTRPAFDNFMSFLNSLAALKEDSPAGTANEPLAVTITAKVADGLMGAFKSAIEADGMTIDEIKKSKAVRLREAQAAAKPGTNSTGTRATGGTANRRSGPSGKNGAEDALLKTENLTKAYEVGSTLLPIAKEIASLLVQQHQDAKAAEESVRRRRRLREEMHRKASETSTQVMQAVLPSFLEIKNLIVGQSAPTLSTIPGLRQTLEQIDGWLVAAPEPAHH